MNQDETVKYLVANHSTISSSERRRLVATLDKRNYLKYSSQTIEDDMEINPVNAHVNFPNEGSYSLFGEDLGSTEFIDMKKSSANVPNKLNFSDKIVEEIMPTGVDGVTSPFTAVNGEEVTSISSPALQRGTPFSAGHDICTPVGFTLNPGSYYSVKTGVKLNLAPNRCATVHARSGLWFKHRIEPFCGLIDADYRDEVIIEMRNNGIAPYTFHEGERIAQLVISEYSVLHNSTVISTAAHTGFGSTGRV